MSRPAKGPVNLPKVTTTQLGAISSPPDGSVVFNSTTGKVNARIAGAWVAIN